MNIAPATMPRPDVHTRPGTAALATFGADLRALGAQELAVNPSPDDRTVALHGIFAGPREAHLASTLVRNLVSAPAGSQFAFSDIGMRFDPVVRCIMPTPTMDAVVGALQHLPGVNAVVPIQEAPGGNEPGAIAILTRDDATTARLQALLNDEVIGQKLLIETERQFTTDV